MEAIKVVLGDWHPDTLTAMSHLASTYWSQGRWNLQEKALEVSKVVLGDRHPETLRAVVNMSRMTEIVLCK